VQLGFSASKADISLFLFNKNGIQIYFLIYVDDIIIISSSSAATDWLLGQLLDDFAVKDLGPLSYFLGIEVSHHSDGLTLTQRKYIHDLLSRINMLPASSVATPMVPTEKIASSDGDLLSSDDATRYRSVVGDLQYLSLTHPDISFSVNRVCQYMSSPTTTHWVAVKRILHYLRDTINFGLGLQSPIPCSSVPSRMPTGLAMWMIEEAQVAMLYFLWQSHCLEFKKTSYGLPIASGRRIQGHC
jgi:hypothetical protein